VDQGHAEAIQALLKGGASIRTNPNFASDTLLARAVAKDHLRAAEVLLAADADPNEVSGKALWIAAGNANRPMVELLLAKGADPAKTDDGRSPLHAAAARGIRQNPSFRITGPAKTEAERRAAALEILKLLLSRGANPRSASRSGLTPLHVAAQHDFQEGAAALIAAGAEVNARDQVDATPLHWAVINNAMATAGLLLAGHANPNLPLSQKAAVQTRETWSPPNPFAGVAVGQQTPLSLATSEAMKNLLKQHGAVLPEGLPKKE
jgi:ankyrin repeat protein